MTPGFTIYIRAGCHLCEQMLDELAVLQIEHKFELDRIDITGNSALEREFGTRIPVLTAGSDVLCEYFLDEEIVRNRLSRS